MGRVVGPRETLYDVVCPGCAHVTTRSLHSIRYRRVMSCPTCGLVVSLRTPAILDGVDAAERSWLVAQQDAGEDVTF